MSNNSSNASASSYETALSSSFDKRKAIKVEEDLDVLENDISMLSVSSPKTPNNQKDSETPAKKLLRSINNKEDKRLLLKLYPEFFNESGEHLKEERKKKGKNAAKKPIKIELFGSDDEKENKFPFSSDFSQKSPTPEMDFGKYVKKKPEKVESSDDEFENYLKKLREPTTSTSKKPEKSRKFVVSDSDSPELESEAESESEAENSEEESILDLSTYSPDISQKKQPKKLKDDDFWFLSSLSAGFDGIRHPNAENFTKCGSIRMKKQKEELLLKLAEIYKRRCFSEIPSEKLKFVWNARLRKSAGQCRNHSNGNSTVEMSSIVCTNAERIRDTLIHEMCHAAVWIVDKLYKEAHGPGWKKWAHHCSRTFSCLPSIERCHNYEIEAKFLYICETQTCQQTIKRQSKSLDISQKICGKCRGRFQLYRFDKRTNRKIQVSETSAPKENEFMKYVRQNFGNFKSSGLKHKEIMAKLAADYKLSKN